MAGIVDTDRAADAPPWLKAVWMRAVAENGYAVPASRSSAQARQGQVTAA